MQNIDLLENLRKAFQQSTFIQSEELFRKIVDMAAGKLLTKQDHHEELTKRIISNKIRNIHKQKRKFKRITKRILTKKKLRESAMRKISISNKQIHERYEKQKAMKYSKSNFQEYFCERFGVLLHSDQEEEKQQSASLQRQCRKRNEITEAKLGLYQETKKTDLTRTISTHKDQVQKRFKKVHTNFQNYLKAKENKSNIDELTCPICIETLIEPVSTICGHSFCFSCLDESLLLTHTCPVCRLHIKGMDLVPCNRLSELIRIKCEGKSMTSEQAQIYSHRKAQNDKWREKRFIKVEKINSGSLIDVRDTQNIWCPAMVMNVFYVNKKISSVLIHYLHWANLYNEVIEIKSCRLAPRGCFTKRTNLPRYNLHQENQNLRGTVVNGNQNNSIIPSEFSFPVLEQLRDLQNTISIFRNNITIRTQQNNFTSRNFFNQLGTRNSFNNSIPNYQFIGNSFLDNNSYWQQSLNDDMAQQNHLSLSLSESVQQDAHYGILNSNEVSSESSDEPNPRENNIHGNQSQENYRDDDEEYYQNFMHREQNQRNLPVQNESGMIIIRHAGDFRNDDEQQPQEDYDEDDEQVEEQDYSFNGAFY